MSKFDFINLLIDRLNGLPPQDIQNYVDYYSEMIDDRIEDGMSEADAVAALGPIDDIALQILKDTPLTKLVKNKVKPAHKPSAFEIILLILGSPVWLAVLIAVFAVIISVYAALWAVVISLYAAMLSIGVSGLGCTAGAAVMLIYGTLPQAAALLGAGLVLAGLCILFLLLCNLIAKGTFKLSRAVILKTKSAFVGKERSK